MKRNHLISLYSGLGWTLISLALLFAIPNLAVAWWILSPLEHCIQMNVPKEFTQSTADGLLAGFRMCKVIISIVGLSCIASVVGGILLFTGQLMRNKNLPVKESNAANTSEDVSR
jgi:hypothetical protein